MENKKIITILLIVILITLILLVVKIKTTTPIVSTFYNDELNNFNYIVNQFNTYNQTNFKNTKTNSEGKIIAVFNNYSQIEKEKQNSTNKKIYNQTNSKEKTNEIKDIQTNSIKQENNTVQEEIYIIEHKIIPYYIEGKVKNNTNNTIKNLTITADCYDKEGNKINYAYTSIPKLDPNETWKFKALISSDTTEYKNIKLSYSK